MRRDVAFVGMLVTVQGIGGLAGGRFSATLVRRTAPSQIMRWWSRHAGAAR